MPVPARQRILNAAELTWLVLTLWADAAALAVAAWPSAPSGQPRPSGISLVLGPGSWPRGP
jgi:hypothetical protein